MDPDKTANETFQRIKQLTTELQEAQSRPPTAILVKVAAFVTEEDLAYFKGREAWSVETYNASVKALRAMCEAAGWMFDDDVVTKAAFQDWIIQHGAVLGVNQRIEYIFTALGHRTTGGSFAAYRLSPVVVFVSHDSPPATENATTYGLALEV